ncbi:hypothetical protein Ae168Ps1_5027c [Pseudonocardia sp. Ae168_Ps1]|nr:hypothetical protein Ae150APs1_4990c [Pseudonocardia sp. Ae150A_Ps1]OLL82621.1 hypothetical protein Ae168Ps1_5027c [Pseudonocardia sp. Ae168_Ps1]OLL83265.1 hypothetical protein Ae263Ps1_0320 [Pseudonocardia sp. Ae263_Ps1]OLL90697.1 hypothetical protein Ae356Ps1_0594c [Pseudonocardia sp. Ae356_Ps1]
MSDPPRAAPGPVSPRTAPARFAPAEMRLSVAE